jgi:hypothetical protein
MKSKIMQLLVAICLFTAGIAHASFHLWRINEIYSNADGSVQFVELTTTSTGQQFLSGHTITCTQGSLTHSYTFPNDLLVIAGDPYYGGGEGGTANASFLIATQGFAALGIVQPDYVVPNGFLFTTNATLNFAGVDFVSYASLPTDGSLSINRAGTTAVNSPKNFAGLTGQVTAGAPNYSDLWWGGTAENGWGMTVQQHGNIQFNVFFVYDGTGKPSWYVMPGGTWNSNFTVYTGGLAKPTSAPLNAYDRTLFVPGGIIGTATITYTSASSATLNYTINGVSGTKQIQRQIFGPTDSTPGLQVGDMWWGGDAQNGWGVSVTQQFRTLFAAWFTYDPAGNVTWFTMPGGSWTGNVYTGVLATATGSPWVGTTYNAAQFAPVAVGTVSFNFSDANNALMTYTFTSGPFAGTTQTKPLVRQPY